VSSSLRSGDDPAAHAGAGVAPASEAANGSSAQPSAAAETSPAGKTSPAAEASPATPAKGARRPADWLTRVLTWGAAICISAAVAVIIAVSAAGPSTAVVTMPKPKAGPPYWLWLHPSEPLLTFVLWGAAGVGGIGVIAGLAAVARGARPPVRLLITLSFLATTVLTLLPAAGSTDILDYAANGRMVVTGHSPYVETPLQLKNSGDPIGRWIPHPWETDVSVYGPVASGEEYVAAELGGTSMARVTFWLKLFNSIAFGAVVLLLDRLLRADPARRLRAHLLWTVNPLLLWEIVASGHIDGLSAAFGLLGIVMLKTGPNGERPSWQRFLLAGVFVGIATAIKAPYAAFGLGVIWAGRKSITSLAAAAGGFLVIFAPAYAIAGRPAISALVHRGPGTTWDTMWQVFYRPFGYSNFGAFSWPPHLTTVAGVAFVAVAILAFLRFPDGTPNLPALSPALALSLAWLFIWSYERPWYDVMAICLLALYPASRLDWVVIVRLIVTAPVYMPGMPVKPPAWVDNIVVFQGDYISAYGRLLTAVAFVALCIFGLWGWRQQRSGLPAGGVPVPQPLV
jgi:alpha-1,6-mannosyltransferase